MTVLDCIRLLNTGCPHKQTRGHVCKACSTRIREVLEHLLHLHYELRDTQNRIENLRSEQPRLLYGGD